MRGATCREMLDLLVSLDPTYVWSEDSGVANLVVASAWALPGYPFNIVLAGFRTASVPYELAFFNCPQDLCPERRHVALFWRPEVAALAAGGTVGHGPNEGPRVTVNMANVTPREILNEVARQTRMSWIAQSREELVAPDGRAAVWFGMSPYLVWTGGPRFARYPPELSRFIETGGRFGRLPEGEVTGGGSPADEAVASVTLAPVLRRAGARLTWESRNKRLTAKLGSQELRLRVGSSVAYIAGRAVNLDFVPGLREGAVCAPREQAAKVVAVLRSGWEAIAAVPGAAGRPGAP
jgi:hypothetical protein